MAMEKMKKISVWLPEYSRNRTVSLEWISHQMKGILYC